MVAEATISFHEIDDDTWVILVNDYPYIAKYSIQIDSWSITGVPPVRLDCVPEDLEKFALEVVPVFYRENISQFPGKDYDGVDS